MMLAGTLTGDASVHHVKDDRQVVNFSIAINDIFKTKSGEWREVTTYVDCAYWKSAKVAKWLKTGTVVQLYGRICADAYINQQGEAVGKIICLTDRIKRLAKAKKREQPAAEVAEQQAEGKDKEGKDDLPF